VNTIRRWPCFARRQVKFAEHLRPSSQVSLASHVIASTLDGTTERWPNLRGFLVSGGAADARGFTVLQNPSIRKS
jgi:hypothetical protein